MTKLPPGYVRAPWTKERRSRASRSGIERSGARAGCRKVYGVDVPEDVWPRVVREARVFRHQYHSRDLPAVRAFIRWLLDRGLTLGQG